MNGTPSNSDPSGVQPSNSGDASRPVVSPRLAAIRRAHLTALDLVEHGIRLDLPEITEAAVAAREALIRAESDLTPK